MQKLIEEIESELNEFHDSSTIEDLLERCKAELEKYRWIPMIERTPEESGEYLCKLIDGREGYSEEWESVESYKLSQAFDDHWELSGFEIVTHWTHIPPTESPQKIA